MTFVPDKATIPIGSFENVTVIATDKYGNKAMCHFQVIYDPLIEWHSAEGNQSIKYAKMS